MASLVVHFEIHASDPDGLIEFYTGLLGWQFTKYPGMEYWTIETGEGSIQMAGPGNGINGGLVPRTGPAPKPGAEVNGANIVVGVDDTDATFRAALDLGGIEAMAPYDLPGVGRVAYVLDPDNNVFGLISSVLSDGTDVMAGE